MRLIYLCRYFDSRKTGVYKKISAQVDHLANLGLDSVICSISASDDRSCIDKEIKQVRIPMLSAELSSGLFNKIKREYHINLALKNVISALQAQDIIYSRTSYPSFQLSRILRQPRACKIVFEHQTIEPLEYRLIGKYWYLIIDFLFGNAIREYTDAIIGVTDEITEYQMSRSGNPKKPHITIGNGFDVVSVPVRQSPVYKKNLHLICVANISQWHGLDRLLRGLATYDGVQKVILHIAGNGVDLPHLQQLTSDLGITDRVIFHGFTTGIDLDNLFNISHIAVGSLGIHRIGLTESSTLKVREYCARGLPWIIGCKDPDFPDDFPYIHRIAADESPVNIEDVIKFTKAMYADHDHPQKMREHALEHLDWSVKMKKLKAFLESLVDEQSSKLG